MSLIFIADSTMSCFCVHVFNGVDVKTGEWSFPGLENSFLEYWLVREDVDLAASECGAGAANGIKGDYKIFFKVNNDMICYACFFPTRLIFYSTFEVGSSMLSIQL